MICSLPFVDGAVEEWAKAAQKGEFAGKALEGLFSLQTLLPTRRPKHEVAEL